MVFFHSFTPVIDINISGGVHRPGKGYTQLFHRTDSYRHSFRTISCKGVLLPTLCSTHYRAVPIRLLISPGARAWSSRRLIRSQQPTPPSILGTRKSKDGGGNFWCKRLHSVSTKHMLEIGARHIQKHSRRAPTPNPTRTLKRCLRYFPTTYPVLKSDHTMRTQ